MFRIILFLVFSLGVALRAPRASAAERVSPTEALARMKTASGFKVSLVAHEPDIRQPLTMTFDARGRMWVIQYLQYPSPAGLTPIKVDQYLRTTYDRRPEPPPRGPKGADRITICEDTNQDGVADKFTDFVSGLNLASGMALGYDTVFVVQPPYLLAYRDRNHDDVPDGDPEVLLTGFGMEDSHAFANSLQWGPDGWLYGAHGSTVTANIRGIEFQQGIWRWHPQTDKFELFAEGGGNTWGLDFDEEGNVIAGTNWGDQIALHQVQGAYYVKGFAKHGPLHNPNTFGYFEHIPYRGFRGGHVTCGGIVYQGGAFPAEFSGRYIAANLLANAVYWHNLERDGSSFRGSFGGVLLSTDDVTFRPIDCLTGPDGCLYVADWCDPRASHVDPLDTWDRTTGRIYRVAPENAPPPPRMDLSRLSSADLLRMLGNRNNWFRREARRILVERRNPADASALRKQFEEADGIRVLESFWTLQSMGKTDSELFQRALKHPSAPVRAWAVRFIGDAPPASAELATALVVRARSDESPIVRSQLAATAKRLPAGQGIPVVHELLLRADAGDPHIPLLLWWALEARALSDRNLMIELFSDRSVWQSALVRQHMLERITRRYATEGRPIDFDTCVELLRRAPGSPQLVPLIEGMEMGLAGRKLDPPPAALRDWFQSAWPTNSAQTAFIRLGVRLGQPAALAAAFQRAQDPAAPEPERVRVLEVLGQSGAATAIPVMLRLAKQNAPLNLRKGALGALQYFSDPEIATQLLAIYRELPKDLQAAARQVLSTRPAWALATVNAVAGGVINPGEITLDRLRQWVQFGNPELRQKIEKIWGRVQADSAEEKKKAINELRLVMKPSGTVGRTAIGDQAAGKKLFTEICAQCHKLFGEGGTVGPDLTGIDRKNLDYLLTHVVDPSAFIRPEFVSYDVVTRDDQMLSGLMVEQDGSTVTILDRNNARHQIARSAIEQLRESQVSLMPEGLLEALRPQQVVDLFSYLQRE